MVFSLKNYSKGGWDHLVSIYLLLKRFISKATSNSIKLGYENSILIMANREHLQIMDTVEEFLKLLHSTAIYFQDLILQN